MNRSRDEVLAHDIERTEAAELAVLPRHLDPIRATEVERQLSLFPPPAPPRRSVVLTHRRPGQLESDEELKSWWRPVETAEMRGGYL